MEIQSAQQLSSGEVKIKKGSILVYRVYDVAEEIDLAQVERALKQDGNPLRMGLRGTHRQAVIVKNPPVRLSMGEIELTIQGQVFRAEATATLWEYGVISIIFQIPVPEGMGWQGLVALAQSIESDGEPVIARDGTLSSAPKETLDTKARAKSRELTESLKGCMKSPHEWATFEDYVIYFLEEVSGAANPTQLLAKADVPSLILAEAKEALSQNSRDSVLETTLQYSSNDLVVIDWNSALVMEPSGQKDICHVLEFAVTHLMEVRYYDDLLDQRLGELYDDIEEGRKRIWKNNFANITEEANARYIEFSEFMEKVDNSLKVVGDFYLATVFRAASRQFRLQDWQQSITRKMNLLAQVSEILQGEIDVKRGFWLEIIVIALITFEILSAFSGKLGGH